MKTKMSSDMTKALPESCIYPNGCDRYHCYDCAFVGKERVMLWLKELNKFEIAFKTVLEKNKDE